MKKMKDIFICLGLILLYLVMQELTSLIFYLIKGNNFNENMTLIICNIIITAIIVLIFRKDFLREFKEFKLKYKNYIPKSLKYWAIGFTSMYILNILIIAFITHGTAPNEEANRTLIKMYPIYMTMSICLTGPLCEELLFRLNFKKIFKKRIVYILFCGILFGAAHLMVSENLIDLIHILPYSALGITFSAICYDTDNVCSSIFAHIFHNSISFLILITFL